jgi:L-rhamnose mutarotase
MKKICVQIAVLILIAALFPACHPQHSEQESQETQVSKTLTRYGWVIQVKAEKLDEYKRLHANPWPEVDSMIKACNIQNYSIYYRDGLLFSYLEYTGDDFEADMARMAADSVTNAWWGLTDPCQEPVESAGEGVWWADMEEVYHLD